MKEEKKNKVGIDWLTGAFTMQKNPGGVQRLDKVGLMALVALAIGYQKEQGKRQLRDTYERLGKGGPEGSDGHEVRLTIFAAWSKWSPGS